MVFTTRARKALEGNVCVRRDVRVKQKHQSDNFLTSVRGAHTPSCSPPCFYIFVLQAIPCFDWTIFSRVPLMVQHAVCKCYVDMEGVV